MAHLVKATKKSTFQQLCEQEGLEFSRGCGYYCLEKKEKIGAAKELVAFNTSTQKFVGGSAKVRALLGLGKGDLNISGDDIPAPFQLFVQSTSANRGIPAGSSAVLVTGPILEEEVAPAPPTATATATSTVKAVATAPVVVAIPRVTALTELPPVLLMEIFGQLDADSALCAMRVCKAWWDRRFEMMRCICALTLSHIWNALPDGQRGTPYFEKMAAAGIEPARYLPQLFKMVRVFRRAQVDTTDYTLGPSVVVMNPKCHGLAETTRRSCTPEVNARQPGAVGIKGSTPQYRGMDLDPYLRPDCSKIGGLPFLPPGMQWPPAFYFAAQLRCEDIWWADLRGLYPRTGMLYFWDNIDDSAPGRVTYVPPEATADLSPA
ncbi:hypothetical protein PAPYR_1575 [Paratrimastix pyriformis]|uniref:F-box domain-containing protein n=1 Tax=Paratrimastix pyriformis TaxID=342808 RepID=A0ABQ8UTY9_9EUKA|nr:hypothetical protein PAPYR_1575 [Paratrimastix pyriformis]